nr:MAG TPA: hypothetical protein [Caudoviricetes sp.]
MPRIYFSLTIPMTSVAGMELGIGRGIIVARSTRGSL